MRASIIGILLWAGSALSLNGQNLVQASASAKKDLEDATARLAELRKSIEGEKIPLSLEISKLEREAQGKRAEVDRLNRLRDNRDANLIQLKEEVKTGNNEIESIRRILADYSRSWSENTPPAERRVLKNLFQPNDAENTDNRNEQIQSLLRITFRPNLCKCRQAVCNSREMRSFRLKVPEKMVLSGLLDPSFILLVQRVVLD
jgi:chromosome segregation ATPase